MINSYAVVMPSIKIGGGNRVLLQFLDEAIKDNKNCFHILLFVNI